MKIWLDIDNPPQVQYLLPFRGALAQLGAETVVTARAYGATAEMVAAAGVSAYVSGSRTGRSRTRKIAATLARAHELSSFFRRTGRPDALLAASRSAAIAAARMRIPSFIIGDYEHANVGAYRLTGSTILHPDVIDPAVFTRALRPEQLVPFRGIKEDLTFAGVDVDVIPPHDLGARDEECVRVLFRPPSQTSHYYSDASSAMARAALSHLARVGAQIVFAPRDPSQTASVEHLGWGTPPIVLDKPVPFVSLLKSVDAVVCAGGTMLREAAFLGIPCYSIFRSEIGAVDRWLAEIGRATLLESPADLPRIELRRRGPLVRLDSNPRLLAELAAVVSAGARQTGGSGRVQWTERAPSRRSIGGWIGRPDPYVTRDRWPNDRHNTTIGQGASRGKLKSPSRAGVAGRPAPPGDRRRQLADS